MAKLMKLPKTIEDSPLALGNITHCQWCGVPLDKTDHLWRCIGENTGTNYLVCFGCHDEAIEWHRLG